LEREMRLAIAKIVQLSTVVGSPVTLRVETFA
ncbi:MAG: hypothetical protein RLZZ344_1817, partial [Pseudomonadota bacterium]